MKKTPQILIGLITHPDKHGLIKLIRNAVSEHLMACGNVFNSEVTSLFTWENKLKEEQESMALFKTTPERKEACIKYLKEQHPYECPEILFIPVADGLADYLNWIQDVCNKSKN